MIKKILHISIWVIVTIGVIVGLFFTRKHYNEKPCVKVNINIDYNLQGSKSDVFLKYADVLKFIHHRFDSIEGKPMGSINIEELEIKTKEIPYVQEADAFKSINGEVTLNIKQRRAIVLVIDRSGSKYYIDDSGEIIPVRMGYPAHVIVCNGNIPAFELYGQNNTKEYKDSIMTNTVLKDVFSIAKYIDGDKFFKKEIVQMYVNNDKEFELIPLVGRHKIIFGNSINRDEKFEKLFAFYQQAEENGAWGKYRIVNLKYKEQIVCTKK